jgi:hypothetical protein
VKSVLFVVKVNKCFSLQMFAVSYSGGSILKDVSSGYMSLATFNSKVGLLVGALVKEH